MKNLKTLFLFIFVFVYYSNIFSVKYGSETNVSVQPFVTFPSSDSDNEMLGFGWFRNGFELADKNTTCTFNSVFPISGPIALHGGSLFLNTDVHLANVTTLTSMGRICGQNHIITLDANGQSLLDMHDLTILKDVDLFINSDLQISTTLKIEGNCFISGHGKHTYMDRHAIVDVGHNATLVLRNLWFEGFGAHTIKCLDDTGKVILDNVSICMDENYNFTTGQLEIWNNVDIYGTNTFFYDCASTITVDVNSTLKISNGSTFAVGVNETLNKDRIIHFEDKSSKLWFDNSNAILGPSGCKFMRGSMVLSGRVNFDIHSTNTSNGLILGDGTLEGDAAAECYPASYITFPNGHIVYNEYDPRKFVSASTYTKLIRGSNNIFHVVKGQVFSNVTIDLDPNAVVSIEPGAKVEYEACRIIMPTVKFSITGSRFNTYTTLLGGDDEIFLENGILPFYLLIQNGNNQISGNGNLAGLTTLYNSNAEITFDMDGQILNNIVLNGGTVNLAKNMEFACDKKFIGSGKVNLANNDLILGSKDLSCTSSIYWDGLNGNIELNAKVSLSGTWTFSGNCTIVGNNNALSLHPSGRIYVAEGSVLNFKNIKICGLAGTNLSCANDSSKIVFNEVLCKLDDDYYFDKGAFDVYDQLSIKSSGQTFHYSSKRRSTITNCSTLIFNTTTVFDYCPDSEDKNLINLQTRDSVIWLKEASLHSTTTGLQLTKGRIFIEGKCEILSDATCKAEAIIFGDGLAESNDLNVKILPGGKFNLNSGYVISKNIIN